MHEAAENTSSAVLISLTRTDYDVQQKKNKLHKPVSVNKDLELLIDDKWFTLRAMIFRTKFKT